MKYPKAMREPLHSRCVQIDAQDRLEFEKSSRGPRFLFFSEREGKHLRSWLRLTRQKRRAVAGRGVDASGNVAVCFAEQV